MWNLNNCYTGMEEGKSVVIDYSTIGLKIYMDSTDEFTHIQVYTHKCRDFYCVEKQTCSTDVPNIDARGFKEAAHLLVVSPNDTFTGIIYFTYN